MQKYFLQNILISLILQAWIINADHQRHVCNHAEAQHEIIEVNDTHLFQSRNLQTSTWSPIRLIYDFSNFNKSLTSYFNAINNTISQAEAFFEGTLLVNPYPSLLTISNLQICPNVNISLSYLSPGVNADLVIFVYATYNKTNPATATGTTCMVSSTLGRPIVGQLYINLYSFDPNKTDYNLNVAIHETTHLLVFSPQLFSRFSFPNPVKNITSRGSQTTIITTPLVQAWARNYFDCSDLEGMELENQGGKGSAGTHWESRLIAEEIMVGSVNYVAYLSDFTAALFNDSGWYQASPSMTRATTFGYKRGCNFVRNFCVIQEIPQFPEFCNGSNSSKTTGCLWSGRYKSSCYNKPGNTSIPDWQYYFNSTASDQFSDNCPDMVPYSNGDCKNASQNWNIPVFQEYYGLSSTCVTGTMVLKAYSTYKGLPNMGCFESHCTMNNDGTYDLSFVIGNATIPCPRSGGNVTMNTYNINYRGNLLCPPAIQYCNFPACSNNCSGNGQCIDGACKCNTGFNATDCSSQELSKLRHIFNKTQLYQNTYTSHKIYIIQMIITFIIMLFILIMKQYNLPLFL